MGGGCNSRRKDVTLNWFAFIIHQTRVSRQKSHSKWNKTKEIKGIFQNVKSHSSCYTTNALTAVYLSTNPFALDHSIARENFQYGVPAPAVTNITQEIPDLILCGFWTGNIYFHVIFQRNFSKEYGLPYLLDCPNRKCCMKCPKINK